MREQNAEEGVTLHITNGDSVACKLRETGVTGRVLPWRDVLHEGPVPGGISDEELRKVRAKFISDQGWGEYEAIIKDFEERDQALFACNRHDEIILWFEHDLYDQLQLIQIIDGLAREGVNPDSVSLICVDRFPSVKRFVGLGQLTVDELLSLYPSRRELSDHTFEVASEAWRAFRSDDPYELFETANSRKSVDLTFLRAALIRHLQEFPCNFNGLSRTESQILYALRDKPCEWTSLFQDYLRRDQAPFLGDTSFKAIVDRLGKGQTPLIGTRNGKSFLTDIGGKVLAGEFDSIRLNGIDRWLGGVHLLGDVVRWRWDSLHEQIIDRKA